MTDTSFRKQVLISLGASPAQAHELLAYTANTFRQTDWTGVWDDEPFVEAWRGYMAEAESIGVFECLKHKLVQLQFPIEKGISRTEGYRGATRRGILPPPSSRSGLSLQDPGGLRIQVHPTPAGHIPVVITGTWNDFAMLVRALVYKNEPAPIPASMGAMMVSGYNNWDRIKTYRRQWRQTSNGDSWAHAFKQLISQKDKYQDRFIILSSSPYSGVSAAQLGLDEQEWHRLSLIIRREHECTHYFTRRVLGSMQNNLFDELIADYMGIIAAAGHFRADWLLHFMGLENYPKYRSEGRLENYVGTLSTKCVHILHKLIYRAAHNLEQYHRGSVGNVYQPEEKALVIRTLASTTLEELASNNAASYLDKVYVYEAAL